MKKLSILSIALLLAALGAQAQKTTATVAAKADQAAIKRSFMANFPTASHTTWSTTEGYITASFVNNGEKEHAYYNNNGVLVGTITDKKFADLPQRSQYYITDHYKDYDISAVAFYDDNEKEPAGLTVNSQSFDNWDHYFVRLISKKTGQQLMLQVSTSGDVTPYAKK